MAEGIVEDTVQVVERYPFWIIGGAAVLLLVWYFWPGSTTTAPQNFTFSYGPSDANIQAGTQLAIQQAADQTAVSIAQLQATSNNTQAGDYYGYLTTNSANNLQAQQLATTTQGSVASQQIGAQSQVDAQAIAAQQQAAALQAQTNQAALAAQTTQTGIAAQNSTNLATIAAQNAQAIAAINASAATSIANTQAQANLVSTDPIAAEVAQDYQAYLGRAPTSPTEDAYWIAQISTGAETAAKVALDIKTSTEGEAYAASHGGV